MRLISLLERQWLVIAYDMLKNNCCHFCDELLQRLGVGRVPAWVLNLAGAGAAVERSTAELTTMRCCKSIAVRAQAVGGPRCCRKASDPEECDGEADVHYLL